MHRLSVLLFLAACAPKPPPPPPPKPAIETWTVDDRTSPHKELAGVAGGVTIRSEAIDSARHTPVKALTAYTIGGEPAFWIAPDRKSIVVAPRAFTDLAWAPVVNWAPGHRGEIGRVVDLTVPPRDLLKLLIRAHVIGTYQHIEATVTLNSETADDARYEAACTAVHLYFTNQRNEDTYEFTFRLDRKTGAMSVERR